MTPVTPSSVCDVLAEYANPHNWAVDDQGIRRVWLEPNSSTPYAYNGFELASAALAERTQQEALPIAWANPVILLPADEGDEAVEWVAKVQGNADSTFSMPLYTRPTSAANSTAPMQPSERAKAASAAFVRRLGLGLWPDHQQCFEMGYTEALATSAAPAAQAVTGGEAVAIIRELLDWYKVYGDLHFTPLQERAERFLTAGPAAAVPEGLEQIMALADDYAQAEASAVNATSSKDADTSKERRALGDAIRTLCAVPEGLTVHDLARKAWMAQQGKPMVAAIDAIEAVLCPASDEVKHEGTDWREPHPPSRHCMCPACIPSFDDRFSPASDDDKAAQRYAYVLKHGIPYSKDVTYTSEQITGMVDAAIAASTKGGDRG